MNKVPLFRVMLASLLFFFTPLSLAIAVDGDNKERLVTEHKASPSAFNYLRLMQQAYRTKNYELIYLSTLHKQLEPMQLIHAVVDGQEVSYFRYLNGTIRESLQYAGKISYFEQGTAAYTLQSRHDRHVFANITNFDYEKGQANYDYVILGKGRIAGKQSIAIRMISKDEYRYNYVIWCDLQYFLPLRLDTLTPSNVVLEQLMVVSLKFSEAPNPWLVKLTKNSRPEIVHIRESRTDKNSQWKLSWLPAGFTIVKQDQHQLVMNDNEPVSYIMIDDGIVNASIYISGKKLALDEQQKLIRRGATVLYTEQRGVTEFNVVGNIPVTTAKRLVESLIKVVKDDNGKGENNSD